jgi:hypothetical protein
MASARSINEQSSFGGSDLIRPSEAHYILVYPKGELLNNILTRIRILRGIATVYQRDTISKSGNRSFVPIEIGFIVPEGYGGRDKFENDMIVSIRKVKGVAELRKMKKSHSK